MKEKLEFGGCMCGAVRYELDSESTWNVYCHCESCRRHTGAPATVLITCTPDKVRWTKGERALYQSSPDRARGFCRDCGTSLTWEASLDGNEWLAIHVSSLDNPENFPPIEHVFTADRIPWYELNDGLPQYEGSKFIEFGLPLSGQNKT